MPERINFSTQVNGMRKRPVQQRKIISLYDLIDKIEKKKMPDSIRQEVIQEVKKYPEGSLDFVWQNIDNTINQIYTKHANKNQETQRHCENTDASHVTE